MNRMMGRQSRTLKSSSCFSPEDGSGETFLTWEIGTSESKKGPIEFSKQLSREKVAPPTKQSSNLVYNCNYSLVSGCKNLAPDFRKMINREGESLQA